MATVLVVGGGLGGLSCAALCARRGHTVRLFERSSQLGGRAKTQSVDGASLNLGPHALYRSGVGMPVLRALGVDPKGGVPPNNGFGVTGGVVTPLPDGPIHFFTSGALNLGGRLAFTGWAAALPWAHPTGSLASWLAPLPADARQFVEAFVRVSTYCNAPELLDAGAAAEQLRAAFGGGVIYLHGGWGQLVEAVAAVAEAAGVRLQTGVGVEKVEEKRLTLDDGSQVEADHIVVAVPPDPARRMGVPWPETTPVRAACLDLVLEKLPIPERRFVLGLDQPYYLSEHSGIAELGGRSVVHVAKYMAPGEGIEGVEAELEALMDLAQPGWRPLLRTQKWRGVLPVASAIPEHQKPRPSIEISTGLWRVGDGVGRRGMLLDAALASAEDVATAIR